MPSSRRVLVSWVGFADLRGFADANPDARPAVAKAIGQDLPDQSPGAGPLRAAVDFQPFDEIHLLGDYDASLLRRFAGWLSPDATHHRAIIKDPTDYAAVYTAAEDLLASVTDSGKTDLWISLTSGTPAMAATLVLLGKTRYPARFLQSHRSEASETNIPFDLTLEYLPELLREPDTTLAALADRNPADIEGFDAIVGTSTAIRLAVGRAKRAAIRDVPVLILGESGTGKELFAHAIHAASPRRTGPFVALNCAAIPQALQESELFGHTKNAFTGATQARDGAFKRADRGTLFLDEFGELDLSTQAALLRALQPAPDDPPCRRTFRPLGADQEQTADVRILAATNRQPMTEIRERRLREDLFYRVSTITLRIPPLRDRRGDIPHLTDALLSRINAEFEKGEPGYRHKSLSGAAKGIVSRHDWPGNVRELNNVLVQAAVMSDGPTIGKADIEAALAETPGAASAINALEAPLGEGFSLKDHLEAIQRHFIERARDESGGVKAHAAALLGIPNYQTLDAQIKRLGVKWETMG